MTAMRAKFLGGAGAIAAMVFVGLQLALYVGGVSYRKECVDRQGQITKSWSFTWMAPIPYLFRPDDPSCIIHTGTRVALNAVGIATFADTTASAVANRGVSASSPSGDRAYWTKISAALADYGNRNEKVTNLTVALRSIDALLDQLGDVSPPAKYASGHAALVAAAREMRRHGEQLHDAAEAADSEAYGRARLTIAPDARNFQRAAEELEMVRARGG